MFKQLIATILALAPLAEGALADGHCSDERASNVPVLIVETPSGTRCQRVLVILGVKIALGGRDCPNNRFIHPAHQECLGKRLVGFDCEPHGLLDVVKQDCECRTVGSPDIGVTMEECVCRDSGTAGTIEDFATVACS